LIRLTVNQQEALDDMRGFRVVALLHTGAAIAVYMQRYQYAQVVDVDGRVYSLSHYLAIIPERSETFA
jgi:hypothetical protein